MKNLRSGGESSILLNTNSADNTRNTAKGESGVGHDQKDTFGFSKIEGAHSREEDRAAVNPNFGKLPGYNDNCSRCAVAYEMRRRGFDVEAKPTNAGNWTKIVETFDDARVESLFSWHPVDIERELQAKIGQWGEGARGIVRGAPKSGSGTGHAFFVEVMDGKPVFSDPQNGRADASGYLKKLKDVKFYRVDNLNVNDKVKEHCRNRGGSK